MNRTIGLRPPRTSVRALAAIAALLGMLALQLPAAAARDEPQAGPQAAPQEGVVNVNTATAEELQRLPGVGPSRATAILKLREKMGGFGRAHHLLRVRGIGRKTFRELRPMLTLEGETTLEK